MLRWYLRIMQDDRISAISSPEVTREGHNQVWQQAIDRLAGNQEEAQKVPPAQEAKNTNNAVEKTGLAAAAVSNVQAPDQRPGFSKNPSVGLAVNTSA